MLYLVTLVVNDIIPIYRLIYLPKKYKEAFLRKTELTMQDNQQIMKKLTLLLYTFSEFMSTINLKKGRKQHKTTTSNKQSSLGHKNLYGRFSFFESRWLGKPCSFRENSLCER